MRVTPTDRDRPIRVLHVFGRMERGGAEMRTLDVMRRLDPQEFQFEFCALSGRSGALDAEVQRLGGRVHLTPLKHPGFPARFGRLLREGRYDAVHSHVHLTSGLVLWLASMNGVPGRIAHFRNTHDGRSHDGVRRVWRAAMRHLIGQTATHIVGVCEGALEAAWSRDWSVDPRCQTIYNGLDPKVFLCARERDVVRAEWGVLPDHRVYLHVGRTAPQKNHRRLLEIFADIVRRKPECRLVLVGRGTDEAAGGIARRVRDLGLQAAIIMMGEREDVPRLLQAADAMLLPSSWEGLPGVVLEACASGLPVLASDLPGVREIASRLSLVRYLPLSASNSEWAALAEELAMDASCVERRIAAAGSFQASVFDLDRSVEAHSRLWRYAAQGGRT